MGKTFGPHGILAAVPRLATGKTLLPRHITLLASSSYNTSMGDSDSLEKHIIVSERRVNFAERETLKNSSHILFSSCG